MLGQYVTVFGDVISHVNISSVKPDDGGEYECVAENRAGRTNHAARLNVYGKSLQLICLSVYGKQLQWIYIELCSKSLQLICLNVYGK
jgi:hypothetical protein